MTAFGEIGHRSYPRRFDAFRIAVALCRNGDENLAKLLKKVPAEYVTDGTVSCQCGGSVEPDRDHWTFCTCGRVFSVGDDGVWAARLEPEA